MTQHDRDRVKRRLEKGFARMLAECEQAIHDARSWAINQPEEPPIDCEWFIVQAAGLRKVLHALERDEVVDPSWIQTEIEPRFTSGNG